MMYVCVCVSALSCYTCRAWIISHAQVVGCTLFFTSSLNLDIKLNTQQTWRSQRPKVCAMGHVESIMVHIPILVRYIRAIPLEDKNRDANSHALSWRLMAAKCFGKAN